MVKGLERGGRCQKAWRAHLRSRVYSETRRMVKSFSQGSVTAKAWAESGKKAGISQDLDFAKSKHHKEREKRGKGIKKIYESDYSDQLWNLIQGRREVRT